MSTTQAAPSLSLNSYERKGSPGQMALGSNEGHYWALRSILSSDTTPQSLLSLEHASIHCPGPSIAQTFLSKCLGGPLST